MALPTSTPPYFPTYSTTKRRPSLHCTHRKLTRLYHDFDWSRCTICNRIPDFGYLYHCTQETNGNLPISDFAHDTFAMELGNLQVHDSELAPCAFHHPHHLPVSDQSSYTFHAKTNLISQDVIDVDMAIDENLARAYDGKRKFEIAFPPDPAHVPTNCDLQVCHACRPLYKDRAWQSLNHVVNSEPVIPNEHEFANRRISDAATLVNIDYRPISVYSTRRKHNTHGTITETRHFGYGSGLSQYHSENHSIVLDRSALRTSNSGNHQFQHDEHASDADDEKEFDNDEDSEATSTDIDLDSAEYSEANDFLPAFNSRIRVLPLAIS